MVSAERRLGDLNGVFADAEAFAVLPTDRLVYRTECAFPVPDVRTSALCT